eukprot:15351922-Ditylum_brightwellii.AAC.1
MVHLANTIYILDNLLPPLMVTWRMLVKTLHILKKHAANLCIKVNVQPLLQWLAFMAQTGDVSQHIAPPMLLDLEGHCMDKCKETCDIILPALKSSLNVSFTHPAHTSTMTPAPPQPLTPTWTPMSPADFWDAKIPVLLHICHTKSKIELPKLWWDLAALSTKRQQKILESTFYAEARALKVDPPHVSHAMLTAIMNLTFHSHNIDSLSSGFSMWHKLHMPSSKMDTTSTLADTWDAVFVKNMLS